jgi:AcrR family transcriptional regulator
MGQTLMRTKTEAKRQEIIQAAAKIFEEFGFERASMSKICSKVGGSKTTLYNYFSSKEELFFEVVSISNSQEFDFTFEVLNSSEEIENVDAQLREFGKRFLSFLYSPKLIKLRRLTISQSGITDLGKITYNNRILKSRDLVSKYLAKAMEAKKIKQTDTVVAARHLYGLLESELMYQFLFQIDVEYSKQDMDDMVDRAVEAFMAAYGI